MTDNTYKKFLLNKKGQIWRYLIAAIIALFVIIIVILIFRQGSLEASGTFVDTLDQTKDCDGDGVIDLTDKCPCDATIGSEWPNGVTQCSTPCTSGLRNTLCPNQR